MKTSPVSAHPLQRSNTLAETIHAPTSAPGSRKPWDWRNSKAAEAAAAISVGLCVATLPPLLASRKDAFGALAPALSQSLMTVGTTMAGFSHVSMLRRVGGDPYGYGMWRAVSLGTAVAVPMLALTNDSRTKHFSLDTMLLKKCAPSSAAIVGVGTYLQSVLDRMRTTRSEALRNKREYLASGGVFILAIAWQWSLLLSYTQAQMKESGGFFPGTVDTSSARQTCYAAAFCMALVGASIGSLARDRGNETLRVASITFALAGIPVALIGAAL